MHASPCSVQVDEWLESLDVDDDTASVGGCHIILVTPGSGMHDTHARMHARTQARMQIDR